MLKFARQREIILSLLIFSRRSKTRNVCVSIRGRKVCHHQNQGLKPTINYKFRTFNSTVIKLCHILCVELLKQTLLTAIPGILEQLITVSLFREVNCWVVIGPAPEVITAPPLIGQPLLPNMVQITRPAAMRLSPGMEKAKEGENILIKNCSICIESRCCDWKKF